MSNPHLIVIPILLALGFAGAWYWINRPFREDEQEPPRGDDLFALWEAIERNERAIGRRFLEVAAGVVVLAMLGGALAGILTRVGAW
jgi:hypothetical protein